MTGAGLMSTCKLFKLTHYRETEQDAREMAMDALSTMIREHIRKSESLPCPSNPRGRKYRMIRLPALQAAKAALYLVFQASGIRKAELARRLGIASANVDRLFDLKHRSRLDHIEGALRALGKQLEIETTDAE